MMMLKKLLSILFGYICINLNFFPIFSQWCQKNETFQEKILQEPRRNASIPCFDLFKYIRKGWLYDELGMKKTYGGKKGISEYFRSQGGKAMCKVFTPDTYKVISQAKRVIGCCDDTKEESCISKNNEVAGECFHDNSCYKAFYQSDSSAQKKNPVDYYVSKESCCDILGGTAWRPFLSHVNSTSENNKCQQCDEDVRSGVQEHKRVQSCVVISGRFLVTFEGTLKEMTTDCTYRIAEHKSSSWGIDLQFETCNHEMQCLQKLRFHFGDDEVVTVVGDTIFINDRKTKSLQNFSFKGFSIEKTGNFTMLKSDFGITLKWKQNKMFLLTVEHKENLNEILGICKDGSMPTDLWASEEIVNPEKSFFVGKSNQTAKNYCSVKNLENRACKSNFAYRDKYVRKCRILLEADAFSECKSIVKADSFHRVCQQLACAERISELSLHALICDISTSYFLLCTSLKIKVLPWMESLSCTWTCSPSMVFVECSTKCHATCQSQNQQLAPECYDDCFPGCQNMFQCPEGKILKRPYGSLSLQTAQCVEYFNCPCVHDNKEYEPNKTIQMKCNTCTCRQKGRWSCTRHRCEGVCRLIGSTHLNTFDSTRLVLEISKCRWNILLQAKKSNLFKIQVSVKISESFIKPNAYHMAALKIEVEEHKIELRPNMEVNLNGTEVELPIRNRKFILYLASSHAFYLEAFGIALLWIPAYDLLEIHLSPAHANKVLGLCGSFTWNPTDDFETPSGDIEISSILFMKHFQLNDLGHDCATSIKNPKTLNALSNHSMSVFNPCLPHAQRSRYAHYLCGVFHSENLKKCQSYVDPTDYEELCFYDVCSAYVASPATVCRSIAAYALKCLQIISKAEKYIMIQEWREDKRLNNQCDFRCPGDMKFKECAETVNNSCTVVTFPFINSRLRSKKLSDDMKCLPSCACGGGKAMLSTTVFQDFKSTKNDELNIFGTAEWLNDESIKMVCVEIKYCPCYKDGYIYEYGAEVNVGCKTCICQSGLWKCSSTCSSTYRCPNGMIFSRKMTTCDRVTCQNAYHVNELKQKGDCQHFVHQGCKCPEGMLHESGKCIFKDDCPCYHAGKSYRKNDVINRSCNKCTCKAGKWTCTHHSCSGICLTYGDSHVMTFDGATYTYQGSCQYTLAHSVDGLFQVTVESIPCDYSQTICSKSVYITVGHNSVHLLRGKRVTVNNGPVGRPTTLYGNRSYEDDRNFLQVHETGIYVLVSWPLVGLSITWDRKTRVVLQLTPRFMGKLEGLCGNYDANIQNDFTTPQMSVENSAFRFVDSWKIYPDCPIMTVNGIGTNISPCELNQHRSAWSRLRCSVISKGHVFESCREVVSHSIYYRWCVFDGCRCDSGGDCECVCSAIAAFAQACANHQVPVRWRTQSLCPIQCERGMVYMACGPMCPKTCFSKDDVAGGEHCAVLSCAEGCFCPDNLVLHEEKCVKATDCPCELDGGVYLPGSVAVRDCRNCTCSEGKWNCVGSSCPVKTLFCLENEFKCVDNKYCVPDLWKCDLEDDCLDGSDESDCNWATSNCQLVGGHLCDDNVCVAFQKKCDGKVDCEDETDETECSGMSDACEEFTCDSGKCLSYSDVCDGIVECGFGDYTDEEGCSEDCSFLDHFTCGDSSCIPRSKLCDGENDCRDGSDERNCSCPPSHFSCVDGVCLDRKLECNGEPECFRGEDESDCSKDVDSMQANKPSQSLTNCSQFFCSNDTQSCLPWSVVCDGHRDCHDGSDENKNCWTDCAQNEVSCDRGLECIDTLLLCNGIFDCLDLSDESEKMCGADVPRRSSCFGFQCKNGSCINGTVVCDGRRDCLTGEDERGCDETKTSHNSSLSSLSEEMGMPSSCTDYTCLNGNCIPYEIVCDGTNDCDDAINGTTSSDEFACATWGAWSLWGACTPSCGFGKQSRVRECKSSSLETDDFNFSLTGSLRHRCYGDDHQSKSCFVTSCQSTTLSLTPWSLWSPCSVTCGIGTRARSRYCIDDPQMCSAALTRKKSSSSSTVSEITSCVRESCPDKNCTDGKLYRDCKRNASVKVTCPMTCRDVRKENGVACVASTNQNQCLSGCVCSRGYVEVGGGIRKCVAINDCPCFLDGKMHLQGSVARINKFCQICKCAARGQWRGCIDDRTCSASQLCGWSKWSNWGPCYGPCGQDGMQLRFRTSYHTDRFGIKRRCIGPNKNSQRCKTLECAICRGDDENIAIDRQVGERWKKGKCSICICLSNKTISCRQ